MTDLLPPYHKPMTSQLDCDLANDRVAALEAELERVTRLEPYLNVAGIEKAVAEKEQAEAALAAERALLEAALHWLTSLKQDYDEDGNGVRKWSDVYDECVANIKRLAACAARPAPEEETP